MGRVLQIIQRTEAFVLATSVLIMAAITIANVLARNLFGDNIAAAQELNQFLIVIICFVGLGYATRAGRHIRMTAVYDLWPPAVRKVLMITISATTALLMLTLAWVALRYALSVDRVSPVLRVPLAYVYLVAPIGLTLAGIQYALTVWRNLTDDEVYISFDQRDGYHEPSEFGEI